MKKFFRFILTAAAVVLGIRVGGQLLPFAAPFLVSLGAAAIIEPAVAALHSRGVPRSIGAGLMTTMLLVLTAGLIGGCAVGGVHLVSSYAQKTPELLAILRDAADSVEQKFFLVLQSAPDGLEQELILAAEGVSRRLSELPVRISEKALEGVAAAAKQSSDWLLFLCTSLVGIYFFSAYYRDIRSFVVRQLSENARHKLHLVRSVTADAAAGYLKVQCMLSGVTFLILLGAFRLMGIDDGFTAALVIAIVDALPILGSGAVLIPWALLSLAVGSVPQAVGLAVVYAVLLVTHNLLQTKLMGSHLGLHPVTALVSLYVGWKLWGIAGMLLLPIVCVLVSALNDAGVLHLYQ